VVSTQITKADKAEHVKRKRHVAPHTTTSSKRALEKPSLTKPLLQHGLGASYAHLEVVGTVSDGVYLLLSVSRFGCQTTSSGLHGSQLWGGGAQDQQDGPAGEGGSA
jgi:glycosyltransferase A (GT-A) superfamily protein (DUF2064 family)